MRCWLYLILALLALPVASQSPDDLNVLRSACQFFAGSPLTAQEWARIEADARKDFATQPEQSRAQMQELRQLGSQLSQIREPGGLIEIRQAGLYSFYQLRQSGQHDLSAEIVLQRARPLAADPAHQVLLLEADLDGVMAYLSLLRQSQGGAPWSSHEVQQFRKQTIQNFARLPDTSKAFLLGGQVFWSVISAQMQRIGQQRQAELQQRLAQQQQVPLSMDAYQVLSNLSRSQHLTTMNILENMGGSGDYWEMVERPSW